MLNEFIDDVESLLISYDCSRVDRSTEQIYTDDNLNFGFDGTMTPTSDFLVVKGKFPLRREYRISSSITR
jgi:hypothetical protein